MNVPNHTQAARIAVDLKRLQSGQAEIIKDWQGNSYQGRAYKHDGIWIYELVHWSTTIAQFALIGGQVVMTWFDARYLSSTTRGFQGRIIKGMTNSHIGRGWIEMVSDQLSQPTGKREIINPQF